MQVALGVLGLASLSIGSVYQPLEVYLTAHFSTSLSWQESSAAHWDSHSYLLAAKQFYIVFLFYCIHGPGGMTKCVPDIFSLLGS